MIVPLRARATWRAALCLALLLPALALGTPRAAAAACVVRTLADAIPAPAESLRAHLENSSCAAISFAVTGTIALIGTLPSIGRPLAIAGPGAGSLVIQGNQTFSLLIISTPGAGVALSGLTLTGGRATLAAGSDLTSINTDLTLTDVALTAGIADDWTGGGLYISGGTSTLTRVAIAGNSASGTILPSGKVLQAGGGLYVENAYGPTTIAIRDSTIVGNTATRFGGGGIAIQRTNSDPARTLSVAIVNTAIGTTASPNRATGPASGTPGPHGGGIFNEGGALTLDNSAVVGNTAAGSGGGIYMIGTLTGYLTGTTLTNSHIDGNAAGSGGGLYLTTLESIGQVSAALVGTTVNGNTARGDGGGMLLYVNKNGGSVSTTLTGSSVDGNTAGQNGSGGGLRLTSNDSGSAAATLTGSSIRDNTAGFEGGGLAALAAGNSSNTKVSLTGSHVDGNTALEGGGLYLSGETTCYGVPCSLRATIADSSIAGNTARGAGGGIWADATKATLTNSVISGNTAGSGTQNADGGGIFLARQTGVSMTNGTISGNRATGSGGGVFTTVGYGELHFATVTGNVANSNDDGIGVGGGLYGNIVVMNSIVVGNLRSVATLLPDDCYGALTSGYSFDPQGYNVWGNAATCPATSAGDQNLLALGLSPAQVISPVLAANGGPTPTHALVAGSPAINAAYAVACPLAPPYGTGGVDQRGVARPQGAGCDVGAFEAQLVTLTTGTTGAGGGTVSPATGPQPQGSVVTLAATPGTGSLFVGWLLDGVLVSWATPVTLTMDADHTAIAAFAPRPAFGDVPAGAAYADPVAQLAARGIINGCDAAAAPPLFCPAESTLRAQMAALIVRAMPGWAGETYPNSFTDRGPVDDELWRRVATLQHYNVAQGYQPEVCVDRGLAAPCFGPTDPVTYGQSLLFVARAMVAKGYWTLQPDDRAIFPDQNGAAGADPNTDRQTLDHRMVVTFVRYAGAPPDVDAGAGVPFRRLGVADGGWGDSASRAWFSRALWQALDAHFGQDRLP